MLIDSARERPCRRPTVASDAPALRRTLPAVRCASTCGDVRSVRAPVARRSVHRVHGGSALRSTDTDACSPAPAPAPAAASAPVDLPVAPIATADDLRLRAPASAVIAEALRVQADAAPRSAAARFLGRTPLSPESRSWFLGAIGELEVGRVLDRLGDEWLVIHAVPVGAAGSDIDHVVVGPAGVFTINSKYHEGMKVWVGGKTLMVNGQRTDHLRNAGFEAKRVTKLLTKSHRPANHGDADHRDRRSGEHHRAGAARRRRRALLNAARALARTPTKAAHR